MRREKVPDLASCSFVSCVERFGDSDMLRRLRLAQVRLPPPQFPFDTGLPPQTPAWDWEDDVAPADEAPE